jgi:hypothetical protein
MSLTQTSTIDQITIEANGVIFYRTNNVVTDGTNQIAQGYVKTIVVPGQDLTDVPTNVSSIANLLWTPTVISEYQASIQSLHTGV